MPSLNDVQVDVTGWTLATRSDTESRWHNAAGDVLSLHHFPLPPDIPAPLNQLPVIRAAYRSGISQGGGGIVEVEPQPLAGYSARNMESRVCETAPSSGRS